MAVPTFLFAFGLLHLSGLPNRYVNRKDSSKLYLQKKQGEAGVPGYKWDEPVQKFV